KYIDQISDADIDHLEVPNGVPIVYEFDTQLNVISKKELKA
ncbi:MAG TPA: phosphoglyceromutase, partial [Lactobacillus sp.]|nr:phosphoglyceromutase [Lactobacillus sp.]